MSAKKYTYVQALVVIDRMFYSCTSRKQYSMACKWCRRFVAKCVADVFTGTFIPVKTTKGRLLYSRIDDWECEVIKNNNLKGVVDE